MRKVQLQKASKCRKNKTLYLFSPGGKQIEGLVFPTLLLLGCDLGDIPPGPYRIDLFREALKANGMPYPQHGILAYSNKTDHLILYEFLSLQDLTGDKISDELTPFTEKALVWKNAMANHEVPVVAFAGSRPSMGMFGLRP